MSFFTYPLSLFAFFFVLLTWVSGQPSPTPDSSRALRLSEIKDVDSSIPPTMDAARYGIKRLFDGKLPRDGWRSTWTAWYQKNPVLTFDCGTEKRIGVIRLYFQAFSREDELKSIQVEVSLDGKRFLPFNEYGEIISVREKGVWVEMDLKAVKGRYFRLSPQFQGWGHQWGEIEFWELAR